MFLDALLPNLLLFAAGQAAAWGWLRTGFVRRGLLVMAVIWTLADWALLSRFVFGDAAGSYPIALLSMQLVCVVEAAWFAQARLRRRYGKLGAQRQRLFAAAFQHYLRGEATPAVQLLQKLLQHDPWDVPSLILLANVEARQGRRPKARRLLGRARGLDRRGDYGDLVGEQLAQS